MAELVSDKRLKELREEHHRYIILLAEHFEFEPKKYISQMREALTNLMELSQGRDVGPAPRIDNQLSPRVRPPPRTARPASPRTARLASPRTARPASPRNEPASPRNEPASPRTARPASSTASSSSDASSSSSLSSSGSSSLSLTRDDFIEPDFVFPNEDEDFSMFFAILQVLIRLFAFNKESYLKSYFESTDIHKLEELKRHTDPTKRPTQILSKLLAEIPEFEINTKSIYVKDGEKIGAMFFTDTYPYKNVPGSISRDFVQTPNCYIHVLIRKPDDETFVRMPTVFTLQRKYASTNITDKYELYGFLNKESVAFIPSTEEDYWDVLVNNQYNPYVHAPQDYFKTNGDTRIIFIYTKTKKNALDPLFAASLRGESGRELLDLSRSGQIEDLNDPD